MEAIPALVALDVRTHAALTRAAAARGLRIVMLGLGAYILVPDGVEVVVMSLSELTATLGVVDLNGAVRSPASSRHA